MIFLPIIVDDKVYVEESDEKTATLYTYLPNEEGLPITFTDQESAVAWVAENVKPEYIPNSEELPFEKIRAKYLKA